MVRKIIFNLMVSIFIFPLFFFVKDLIVINPDYYRYDLDRDSLLSYTMVYVHNYLDMFMSIIFLFTTLLPFQLIKDYRYKRNNKGLALWKKCLLLSGIIAFWFAVLFRPPITEMEERIILFGSILLIGTVFSLILYLTVDRYVERKSMEI